MNTVSANQFRNNFKTLVKQIVSKHTPIKITRRSGDALILMSAADWEREQETLYVLQNTSLMKQIADSLKTHMQHSGYSPTNEEMIQGNLIDEDGG